MVTVDEIITKGVVNILPERDKLKKVLSSDKKLNVYMGIDPTATKIHIGHAVPLRKLQALANLGHNVIFLIGDFTALIGDTSDKDKERPVLTIDEIKENFKTYKKQAEKFLDFSKVTVKFNSEWLKELSFGKIIELCQHFSVGDFVGRTLIKTRLANGKRVGLHETLYPVMQGYDSYFLDTDIQIGGADQIFNMQAGRTLQKDLRNKESFIIATDYLLGTDGAKMSKTSGNAIWIEDSPQEVYGKAMSLDDSLVMSYFELATNTDSEDLKNLPEKINADPFAAKKKLAYTLVRELHSEGAADEAKTHFENTFSKGKPSFVNTLIGTPTISGTIAQIPSIGSLSEAKRRIFNGAVFVNDEKVTDPSAAVSSGDKIRAGKKDFYKVK